MKETIKNKLLNSVRISMLNCVDSLDEDMLKKELKENLQKRFELEDTLKEVREYIEYQLENLDFEEDTKAKMLGAMVLVLLDKENNNV